MLFLCARDTHILIELHLFEIAIPLAMLFSSHKLMPLWKTGEPFSFSSYLVTDSTVITSSCTENSHTSASVWQSASYCWQSLQQFTGISYIYRRWYPAKEQMTHHQQWRDAQVKMKLPLSRLTIKRTLSTQASYPPSHLLFPSVLLWSGEESWWLLVECGLLLHTLTVMLRILKALWLVEHVDIHTCTQTYK